MYLSRLFIRNYRSIREMDIAFSKGKNVIVGRNNAGKSNILHALNIVLGENNPTFAKFENITEADFHTWKQANSNGKTIEKTEKEIFIWCELERDAQEVLNYDEMYKCFGFYIHSSIKEWDRSGKKDIPIKEYVRLKQNDLPMKYETIFDVSEEEPGKEYINPKNKPNKVLENVFEDKYDFAFAFRARLLEEAIIDKELRFLFRENKQSDWILCFKAPFRNELLQSAIIPSFRDPQNQLRLTAWSWYGKLMKHLTAGYENNEDMKKALTSVKDVADKAFASITEAVEQSSLDVAFPGTKIHFQFNAEKRKTYTRAA